MRSNDATTPTLAQMGLTRDESSRYQQLAAMPADHFETAVATAKATAGEVTTAFMLREAKQRLGQGRGPHPYGAPMEPLPGLSRVTSGGVPRDSRRSNALPDSRPDPNGNPVETQRVIGCKQLRADAQQVHSSCLQLCLSTA